MSGESPETADRCGLRNGLQCTIGEMVEPSSWALIDVTPLHIPTSNETASALGPITRISSQTLPAPSVPVELDLSFSGRQRPGTNATYATRSASHECLLPGQAKARHQGPAGQA
jgi:hypothetical protein